MTEGIDTAAASFLEKWYARWPEWRIGIVFVPKAQRMRAMAWFALLQECMLAAWTGEDATPGLAKLAWWNEELIGWSKGARRHPLGLALLPMAADWSALASTLRSLQATRERAPAAAIDDSGLQPFSAAVARIEANLLDAAAAGTSAMSQERDRDEARDGVIRDLLAERALLSGDTAVAAALVADRAPHSMSSRTMLVRARRIHSAFLYARLRALAAGNPPAPSSSWHSMLLAWRAARG